MLPTASQAASQTRFVGPLGRDEESEIEYKMMEPTGRFELPTDGLRPRRVLRSELAQKALKYDGFQLQKPLLS
jgi:hypothetical protein